MSHPLHRVIGNLLSDEEFPGYKILRDPACGEGPILPLFISEKKSSTTELCNVDLIILKPKEIKVIIEIEESNVKPTHIYGKFLASASAKYLIQKTYSQGPIGMGDNVLFIQILKKPEKGGSKKEKQWKNIENSIQSIIPIKESKVVDYRILSGSISDFKKGKRGLDLIRDIKKFLIKNP